MSLTPIEATPLAERIKELEAEVTHLRHECVATGDAAEMAVEVAKGIRAQRNETAAELAAERTLSAAYQEQLAAEKLAHLATYRTLDASRMLLEAETRRSPTATEWELVSSARKNAERERDRLLADATADADALRAEVARLKAERDSWAVTYRESSDARLKAESERDDLRVSLAIREACVKTAEADARAARQELGDVFENLDLRSLNDERDVLRAEVERERALVAGMQSRAQQAEAEVERLKAERHEYGMRVAEAAWNLGHSCGFGNGVNLGDPGEAGEVARARDVTAILREVVP